VRSIRLAVIASAAVAFVAPAGRADSPPPCAFDIFVQHGGATTDVTNTPTACEFNPDWSANGKQLVFDHTGDVQTLWTADLGSGAVGPLPGAPGGANNAAYSPDGRTLAFDRFFTGDSTVYLLPSGGGFPVPAVQDAADPDWSPSSQRLVYWRPSDGSIRTIDLASGDEGVVAGPGAQLCGNFECGVAWSPDGRYVAYSPDGLRIKAVRVDPQGNAVGDPFLVFESPAGVFASQPAFSRDGHSIVFTSNLGENGRDELWRVTFPDGVPALVPTTSQFSYDPALARAGDELAYAGSTP
jgi:Tol biopolymer transport system component